MTKETIIMDQVRVLKNKIEAGKDGCKIIDMAKYEKRRMYQEQVGLFAFLLWTIFGIGMGVLYTLTYIGAL